MAEHLRLDGGGRVGCSSAVQGQAAAQPDSFVRGPASLGGSSDSHAAGLLDVFLGVPPDLDAVRRATEGLLFESLPRDSCRNLRITALHDERSFNTFRKTLQGAGGHGLRARFLWHHASSAAAADLVQAEGVFCDVGPCTLGRRGRGGCVATSAAKANARIFGAAGGERHLFLVLGLTEEEAARGDQTRRPLRTGVERPSPQQTEYCFIDQSRLHCACRVDYTWVPAAARARSGDERALYKTPSGRPVAVAMLRAHSTAPGAAATVSRPLSARSRHLWPAVNSAAQADAADATAQRAQTPPQCEPLPLPRLPDPAADPPGAHRPATPQAELSKPHLCPSNEREHQRGEEQQWNQAISRIAGIERRIAQLEDAAACRLEVLEGDAAGRRQPAAEAVRGAPRESEGAMAAAPDEKAHRRQTAEEQEGVVEHCDSQLLLQIGSKVDAMQQQMLEQVEARGKQLSEVCVRIDAVQSWVADHLDARLQRVVDDITAATLQGTGQLTNTILERVGGTEQLTNTILERVRGSHNSLRGEVAEISRALAAQSEHRLQQVARGLFESMRAALRQALHDMKVGTEACGNKAGKPPEQLGGQPPNNVPGRDCCRDSVVTSTTMDPGILEPLRSGTEEIMRELEDLWREADSTENLHYESMESMHCWEKDSFRWQASNQAAWRGHCGMYVAAKDSGDLRSLKGGGSDIDQSTDVTSEAGTIDSFDLEQQFKNMVADWHGSDADSCGLASARF